MSRLARCSARDDSEPLPHAHASNSCTSRIQAVRALAAMGKFIGSDGTMQRDIPLALAALEDAITASVKGVYGSLIIDGATTRLSDYAKPTVLLFVSSALDRVKFPSGVVLLDVMLPPPEGKEPFDALKIAAAIRTALSRYRISWSNITVGDPHSCSRALRTF